MQEGLPLFLTVVLVFLCFQSRFSCYDSKVLSGGVATARRQTHEIEVDALPLAASCIKEEYLIPENGKHSDSKAACSCRAEAPISPDTALWLDLNSGKYMSVWSIDSIEDRPDVTLRDWAVFEVPLYGADRTWTWTWPAGRVKTSRAIHFNATTTSCMQKITVSSKWLYLLLCIARRTGIRSPFVEE